MRAFGRLRDYDTANTPLVLENFNKKRRDKKNFLAIIGVNLSTSG